MTHPYSNLPTSAFWRTGVSDVSPLELENIYVPRFAIDRNTAIASAGSCFAQHIGRQFRERGYRFLDLEPAPPLLNPDRHEAFGFGLYSARYGNLYSMRQLLQLFRRAYGEFTPRESEWLCDDGRAFDPFRPSIEPGGFSSREELRRDTDYHLSMVRRLLPQTELFVFAFGLTESWVCTADGAVLPTCPGTVAGEFDASRHHFHNFRYEEVIDDARQFIALARRHNPAIRFLFTVSPVPLTATASGKHVLPSTVYSKSVLRAVCGALYEEYEEVDYFPSYELVTSHPMRGMFFHPNLRGVSKVGVQHVMKTFFEAHGETGSMPAVPETRPETKVEEVKQRRLQRRARKQGRDAACDEEILENFAK